ncbi:MAG TPA: alkaline phosphatase family protein [Terriglobales bacterium]|nr:alkaline phosphatase family protein [Terriglobales bacterium]
MTKNSPPRVLLNALLLVCLLTTVATAQSGIKHVLLISVDGLHALDVANYVKNNPNSALAELSRRGITYSDARTPANSDSFPGLLALVTGGSPITTGLFYDVSYDRTLFDPTNTTCTGTPGNMMVFDETIDLYNSQNVSLDVIDPTKLPRRLRDGNCVAIFPPQRAADQHDLRGLETETALRKVFHVEKTADICACLVAAHVPAVCRATDQQRR